jgi:60S ribosomal subunit assembly/export protein LOC1
MKNKQAAPKSGVSNSKVAKRPSSGGSKRPKGPATATQVKGRTSLAEFLNKRKPKSYAEKDLNLPKLNTITPIGVTKPKGKKKGKVFVDDKVGYPKQMVGWYFGRSG